MSGSHDHRAAARQDADLMVTDLMRVSGMLEEAATVWRRADLYGQQSSPGSPGALQRAVRKLADDVRAIPEADSEQQPALAFSAAAQLATLERNATLPAKVTGGSPPPDTEMRAAIQGRLHEIRGQLWSLISALARIGETSLTGEVAARLDAAPAGSGPASPQPPAGSGEWQRALAMHQTALHALPEVEVRRLLQLIGGIDPAALQRAATAYTETFCAVAGMEASVAALQPVALAAPPDDLQDPEP